MMSNPIIRTTSELPIIIPPLPKGDTKDLKVWKEYWEQHDAVIRQDEREKVLDDFVQWIISPKSGLKGYGYILDILQKYKEELRTTTTPEAQR